MGTKNNPGSFDCFEAADPDEPMFVLLARDQLAPYLVEMWAQMRSGDVISVYDTCNRMVQDHMVTYTPKDEKPKVDEAVLCIEAMEDWYGTNRR